MDAITTVIETVPIVDCGGQAITLELLGRLADTLEKHGCIRVMNVQVTDSDWSETLSILGGPTP